jgi:hypothetical protein
LQSGSSFVIDDEKFQRRAAPRLRNGVLALVAAIAMIRKLNHQQDRTPVRDYKRERKLSQQKV